jgi:DNA-binding transcriptional MerR regulator/quercetin dioxygenase-like cupin family protein
MAKSKSQPSRPRKAPTTRYGFLTVGQTARILGVSPSTLRLWESEGLVAPLRTGGRYRLYSPELLQVLKRIKYLREVQRLNMPGIRRELSTKPADTGASVNGGKTERKAPSPQPGPAARGVSASGWRSSPRKRGEGAAVKRKRDQPLGPQLRRMRERKGLGLVEAARRAGLSPGFLSSVERSQANASVATLQRLAGSYGTTVMELFQSPPHEGRLVGPSDRRVLTVHSGVRMELLSTGAPMLQSMLFKVAPTAGSEGAYSHQGEEFIYMLAGTLEVWLDELQCYVLREGDSFWFPSTHAHRWFNPGDVDAVLLWINTPPTF